MSVLLGCGILLFERLLGAGDGGVGMLLLPDLNRKSENGIEAGRAWL